MGGCISEHSIMILSVCELVQTLSLLTFIQCINQQDHTERGFQVRIMQLIYQNAEQVIVFMGDGRGHRVNRSHFKEPHVSPMASLNENEWNKLFLTNEWSSRYSSGPHKLALSPSPAICVMGLIALFSDQESVEKRSMDLMNLSERKRCELFEHFRAFATCPWWSRIWVVQEVAVGAVVNIQYGTITLPWESLVKTANVWSLANTRQVASSVGIEPQNLKVFDLFANQLTGLEQTRRKWHVEGGTDLVRLLQEFSHRQASDDRDKVYGLLSLAKRDQQYLNPDYELDVFRTYRATALALIGDGGSLACWAGDQKRKFNKGLASWIPDWSTAVDAGDKRRMDLFDNYSANCGWTLRFIESEGEYWNTVSNQMELLIKSPAGRTRRLPASLRPFVIDYMRSLMQWTGSLLLDRVDAEEQEPSGMDRIVWDLWGENTLRSAIEHLKWCEQHDVFPHSGISLLQRWIRDLENHYRGLGLRTTRRLLCLILQQEIRKALKSLAEAIKDEKIDTDSRMIIAKSSVYRIEAATFVSKACA